MVYTIADFAGPEDLIRFLEGGVWAGAAEERWRRRDLYEEILRRSNTRIDDPRFEERFPENSAQFIARAWLREWRRYETVRSRIEAGQPKPGDLDVLTSTAGGMDRLVERMFWRAGVDPQAGKRREALALVEREADAGRRRGHAGNASKADGIRITIARLARSELTRRPGASALQLARLVRDKWPEAEGGRKPSVRTIRRHLSKV